ncbi:MAG: hypothetical protein C0448_15435 [Sphingobacteriaceae bacterium]|nr:hypothetical protein [Sphingobacteriaceae bacterium]
MTNITSIIFIIAITFLSLFSIHLLNKIFKIPLKSVKHESIEGLRGYLAFFVFIHHAIIYYYYLRTNHWNIPNSKLFNHFGETSVVLFFMITSFLFVSKLLNQTTKTDWTKLFTSRILRIYPAFLLLFIIQIILIFYISDFQFIESPMYVFKEIIIWLGFSIIDYLPINGYKDTNLMTANVLWTIRYEWVFYFSLPLLSLIISKHKPNILIVLFTISIMCAIANYIQLQIVFLYTFAGGVLAAFAVNNHSIKKYATKSTTSILVLGCLTMVILCFDTAYSLIPICILTIAFIGIACGNTLFGILTLKISKLFGQLSYSIYLFHGIVLYFIFIIVIGFKTASHFSVIEHWLVVSTCCLLVVLMATICFKWIEQPCINSSIQISIKLKEFFSKKLKSGRSS